MAERWRDLPWLPAYAGEGAYAALPGYAAALHRAAGLAGPPYDTLCMAEALGVGVRRVQTYEGNRGLLVPLRDGGYRIVVRADESPSAQRFTVAHELVELGLQLGCPALVARSHEHAGAKRAKERYCEAGAAEILLPLARVKETLSAGRGIAGLLDLATLFGASLHATLRRLVDASPAPCAGLILCTGAQRGDLHAGFAAAPERAQGEGDETGDRGVAAAVAAPAVPWEASSLRVSAACGGGGLIAGVAAGTPVPVDSVLVTCHRERTAVSAVERLSLGRLQGLFRVEAICPGRGFSRHVYALLHPI
jgi:hypothetical protein